mgnify:CR=1 FL=1
MSSIHPRRNQMEEVISKVPKGIPVVMLNMLRFKERAKYPDGKSDISGREAYEKYSKEAFKHVNDIGGKVVWFGEAQTSLIGPTEECWDQIFLVQYPSIEKFVEMINSPPYQEIVVHRSSALEDSRLIVTIQRGE